MKITDEAVEAAVAAAVQTNSNTAISYQAMEAALEAALPHLSQGAVSGDAQDIADRLRTFFKAPGNARRLALDAAMMIEHLNPRTPAPVGVREDVRGMIAYALTKRLVIDMPTARAAVDEALASHEPALEMCATDGCENRATHWRGKFGVGAFYCETCDGKIAAGIAKERAPTDTQEGKELGYNAHGNLTTFDVRDDDTHEGVSEAGEVVAWMNSDHLRKYFSDESDGIFWANKEGSQFYDTPLVRQSALTACQQEVERLRTILRWAHDTLIEINPSNYDHEDVCRMNSASVEVILGIAPEIGETHGKTPEWWSARAVLGGQSNEA